MKRTLSLLFLIFAAGSSLCACGSMQRSVESGYAYKDSQPAYGRDRKAYETEKAADELGIAEAKSLSGDQREAVQTRVLLRKAERNLEGKRERDQYFRNKPFMRSDRERIEFLRLDSYETRERWLNARGIQGNATAHAPEIQSLIDQNDITLGMTKQAVREAWGEPETVEVAGNPMYGNERWQYSEQITSSEGYQTERRMVYFESGRVVGWEKQ